MSSSSQTFPSSGSHSRMKPPPFKTPFAKKPHAAATEDGKESKPKPTPAVRNGAQFNTATPRRENSVARSSPVATPPQNIKKKSKDAMERVQEYLVEFNSIQRSLSKPDDLKDDGFKETVEQFYNFTKELSEGKAMISDLPDGFEGQMDACGTQLWNMTQKLLDDPMEAAPSEKDHVVAIVCQIAVLQLEMGMPEGADHNMIARMVKVLSIALIMCLNVDLKAVNQTKSKCVKYMSTLKALSEEEHTKLTSEAMATYNCALFAMSVKTSIGDPERSLKDAIDHCHTLDTMSWPFQETIKNAIKLSNDILKRNPNGIQPLESRKDILENLARILSGLIGLTGGIKNEEMNTVCCRALRHLAQCQYDIAQLNWSDGCCNQVFATLDVLDSKLYAKEVEDKDRTVEEKRSYALLEELGSDFNAMEVYWKAYAEMKQCRDEDIDRIIRLQNARDSEKVSGFADYQMRIGYQIINTILWNHQKGGVQYMIGKVLISTIGLMRNHEHLEHFERILHVIAMGKVTFELNVDVALACQSLLFKMAEEHRAASIYKLAGHEAFHKHSEGNAAKALCKAAWQYMQEGNLEEAQRMTALSRKHFGNKYVTLTLMKCLISINQKQEEEALKDLESLSNDTEFNLKLIPMVVQAAQDAGLKNLEIEALAVFVKKGLSLLDSQESNEMDLVGAVSAILQLQCNQVGRGNVFNEVSIASFIQMAELALNVIDKLVRKDVHDNAAADVATWTIKKLYYISSDDKQCISPSSRRNLSRLAGQMIVCRKDFTKTIDDECQMVELWICLNMLTNELQYCRKAQTNQATDNDKEAEEHLRQAWQKVINLTNHAYEHLQAIRCNPAIDYERFRNVELPLIVSQGQALIELQDWEEIKQVLNNDSVKESVDALQSITHLVCSHESSPDDLRLLAIRCTCAPLWEKANKSPSDILRLGAWFQRLTEELHLIAYKSNLAIYLVQWNDTLNTICKELKEDKNLLKHWPKDSLQWMCGEGWIFGGNLIDNGTNDLAQDVMFSAAQMAELISDPRAKTMTDFLDRWQVVLEGQ